MPPLEMITVFVSYSRESVQHMQWVHRLADTIERLPEFKVVFDQYDLYPGRDLNEFMDRALRSDRVILVITPTYVQKASERSGGVGYESSVVSADLLTDQLQDRFIPVVRAGSERPAFLRSKLYVDFRDDERFDAAIQELRNALLRHPQAERPSKQRTFKTLSGESSASTATKEGLQEPVTVTTKPNDSVGVKVAFIGAIAVVVAAVVGITPSLLSILAQRPSPEKGRPATLQIFSVECPYGGCGTAVRLIVSVNGVPRFSYPTRNLGAALGRFAPESFPLPDLPRYHLTFEAIANTDKGELRQSIALPELGKSDLPNRDRSEVIALRGPDVVEGLLQVKYEVE